MHPDGPPPLAGTVVTLRYFDGCPSWEVARARLDTLAGELGFEVVLERVETAEEAERVGFLGSPSLVVGGRDLFAAGDEPAGLACRVYDTPEGPAGAPTLEQLREALADRA